MDKVRIGIIGMGNIGRFHAGYLLEGKVSRAELVAVCSTSPHKLDDYKAKGLKVFGDGNELIASGEIDAVIVATPHYQHTSLGIAAIEAGVHVMVEKPISAHKADAEKLIAAAQAKPEVKFGAMFQLRAEPRYATIRQLLEGGELGGFFSHPIYDFRQRCAGPERSHCRSSDAAWCGKGTFERFAWLVR